MAFEIHFHGIGQYGTGDQIGPARWPYHDLIVLPAGSISMQLGETSLLLQQGDALLIPPGNHFHGVPTVNDCQVWVVHFSGYRSSLGSSAITRRRQPLHLAGFLQRPMLEDYCQRIHTIHTLSARLHGVECRALLRIMLAHAEDCADDAASGSEVRPDTYRSVLEWAQQHLAEGVQVADLARRCGLSESHFRARFRAACGVTPSRALRDLRLREASRLLRHTSQSVAEVARRVGYSDVVAFHRAFRSSGETPARYRRKHRRHVA